MERFFDFPISLRSFFEEIDRRFDCVGRAVALDVGLRAARLGGIRAVLWDIYGTLIGCGVGDLAASMQDVERQREAAGLLIREFGLEGVLGRLFGDVPSDIGLRDRFLELIAESHSKSRAEGVEYPEVVIEEIWRRIVEDCCRGGWRAPNDEPVGDTAYRWAYFFEAALQRTYLYPDAAKCLDALRRGGIVQGIISNAQFYTPIRLRRLLRRELGCEGFELGDMFTEALVMFSYELGFSKPNPIGFVRCVEYLKSQGIWPSETLYVGNDMLNDIWAAQRHGFRTVLFVGDSTQAKLRREERRCRGIEPDAIIADLNQPANLVLNQ